MRKSPRFWMIFAVAVFAAIITLAVGGLEIAIAASQSATPDAALAQESRYIAHRGLSSLYYQNTEEAFVGAGQSDFFYGIETDVWPTKDGKWVCCHDANPFADPEIKVSSTDYQEAITTPLSPQKAGKGVTAEGDRFLCSLETYLTVCKTYGKTPFIEIKYSASASELRSLLAAAGAVLSLEKIQFISFHKNVIDSLLALDSSLTVQWLAQNRKSAYWGSRCGYNMDVSAGVLTPSLVKAAHRKNRYISVWTVNDKNEAQKFAAMGVDYITTDFILN